VGARVHEAHVAAGERGLEQEAVRHRHRQLPRVPRPADRHRQLRQVRAAERLLQRQPIGERLQRVVHRALEADDRHAGVGGDAPDHRLRPLDHPRRAAAEAADAEQVEEAPERACRLGDVLDRGAVHHRVGVHLEGPRAAAGVERLARAPEQPGGLLEAHPGAQARVEVERTDAQPRRAGVRIVRPHPGGAREDRGAGVVVEIGRGEQVGQGGHRGSGVTVPL
jgi:hypothetical protein